MIERNSRVQVICVPHRVMKNYWGGISSLQTIMNATGTVTHIIEHDDGDIRYAIQFDSTSAQFTRTLTGVVFAAEHLTLLETEDSP